MKQILVFILCYLLQAGIAQAEGWYTQDGEVVPNSDSIKSIAGFGAWLVVTPDKDWEEKWDTPPETTPYFTEASEVSYGDYLTILTFFINPALNEQGEVKLLCDIKVTRPDGTFSIDMDGIECASGVLKGNPRNVRLTSIVLKYIAEKDDLLGKWGVDVTVRDSNRRVDIPLKTHFVLKNG
ncbi:hypothetical protein [Neptuniibacter caesariensis]|uniref:Uncharacterized protein n=1 Tax=Neptuniibacter caesariensis TaxID=207954 RepID=A0A7U8GQW3_NEPCE|nr:hypothetical protein [Neptuniibacter caesariensis]EAR59560.1 hypothetical protein MED92_11604 [Oceanospirillum sp. MED92] [Neptuniibacter caesariensis]